MLRYDADVLPSFCCCDWYLASTPIYWVPLPRPLKMMGKLKLVSFGFVSQKQVLPCNREHPHAPSAEGREARVPRRAGEETKSLLNHAARSCRLKARGQRQANMTRD